MKKKQLSSLLAAFLLGMTISACGADNSGPAGQDVSDTDTVSPGSDTEEAGQSITDEQQEETAANEGTAETDTSVTNDESAETENGNDSGSTVSPVSVTFQETYDEIKADDGTVLLTNSASMPVVSIEGAEDIAAKINADIETYFNLSADEETLAMARSDYEASQADEDGGWFHGYDQSVSAEVTRMDDKVLSLELTSYSDTGGAHGNYGTVGINYDVTTGGLIGLEDLTEDYAAFHAAALDYAVSLSETPAYQEKLFAISIDEIDSALFAWGHWIFTQSGISFMSDPYALGPYASGEIYFRMPYEKAYELGLKENYRYSGNFTMERYYTSQYDADTMEPLIDGTPEYSFDLNGDGTEEGIAFYGLIYAIESGNYSLYIDGKDWGDVIKDAIGDAASNGYQGTDYALYDIDPGDGLTEIAVLFTELGEEDPETGLRATLPYTYLFQYTPDKELVFTERLDGYVTKPAVSK